MPPFLKITLHCVRRLFLSILCPEARAIPWVVGALLRHGIDDSRLLGVGEEDVGNDDSDDDVIDMCRVEPMLTQSAIATLADRLRHCRFRALRRAAPVNGRAFGLVSFLSHGASSRRSDARNASGRPAGRRRGCRLPGDGRLRARPALHTSDDLGALLVELHGILLKRLFLAVFQILALVIL